MTLGTEYEQYHTIEANFNLELKSNVVDMQEIRQQFIENNQQKITEEIVTRMALSICPQGTYSNNIPNYIMNEAWKTYIMNVAMSAALEEIKGNFTGK